MPQDSAADAAFLDSALTLLALRLKHEVALTRALRGDARQEGFLGLFLSEDDAQAMLDELAGRIGVEGGQETLQQIAGLETALRRFRDERPQLVWARLLRDFALSEAELDLLLLAAAPAIDPRFGRVYGFLHDDMNRRALSPALAHRLLAGHELGLGALRALFADNAALRRHGLIRLASTSPMIEAAVTVPEELIDRLLGCPRLATELVDCVERHVSAERGLSSGQNAPTPAALQVLVGRDCGASALALAQQHQRPLLRLDASRLVGLEPAAALERIRSFLRDARFDGDLPYLSGFGNAAESLRGMIAPLCAAPLIIDAAQSGAWAAVGLHAPERAASEPSVSFVSQLPDQARRSQGIPLLDRLSISACAATQRGDLDDQAHAALIGAALNARAARHMHGVAQCVPSSFGFDDLILPPMVLRQLADFVSWRAHAPTVLDDWGLGATFNRRHGAVALFRGPPGTGKTMAASVIAQALGLPLYRIDLAGMVSKYIGETEKNLERLFEAASHAEVVLFFDEADALFGKRSEVSDAHDRYANIETSYLLQRIEAQDSTVILATNLQDNIDEAFLRRIDLVVDFPAPGVEDRLRLWQRLERSQAPVADDVDLRFLAEGFDLSGGEIRNVILTAAHAAARDGSDIRMGHLVRALALELQKLGRPLRRQSFGPHHPLLREVGT